VNYDQFASNFQNPEDFRCGESKVETKEEPVVLAGTILVATDESCCIDINGRQYEVAADDVIDIQVVSRKEASPEDRTEATEPPAEDKVDEEATDGPIADDLSAARRPQFVLIRVNKNAVLQQRVAVPAALLAAVGTWVQIVPPNTKVA
jgi:hypothetical protein